MVIGKLTRANFSNRRTRTALTVLAIALSVSLVVAVTSGYASAEKTIMKYFNEIVGAIDLKMTKGPEHDAGRIKQQVLADLRRDPQVRTVSGRLETKSKINDADNKPYPDREMVLTSVIGVKLPEDVEIGGLQMEPGTNGRWFDEGEDDVAVIDQEAAKTFKVQVGGVITMPSEAGPVKLKVVGIVHKPAIVAVLEHTIYVPLSTLQRVLNAPGEVGNIRVVLRPGTDVDAFAARWRRWLQQVDPYVVLSTTRESRKKVLEQLQGVEFLSYMGGAVSMVAATFIVFSTLAMGVAERQRTLAMLRAIGGTKSQVARLVLYEGIILGVAGVAFGVPLGILWVRILTLWKSQVFVAGMALGVGGIVFAAVGSVLTSLAAGIMPAWNASRVDPVEAMSGAVGTPQASRLPFYAAFAGAVLVCVDSFLMYGPSMPREVTFYGHFFLGLPSVLVGFFLLAPAVVWVVEKTLGRVMALVMGIRYPLLAQQLTAHIWRAAGTAAALMVGLAILIVMQTHGKTLLSGWQLPTNFPDIFMFAPSALTKEQAAKLNDVQGIRKGEVMAIGFTATGLPPGFFSVAAAAVMPDTTSFFAVDPHQAFRMMELKFLEGTAEEAANKMVSGRYIVVTDEFRQLKKLHVGDKLKLRSRKSMLSFSKEIEYEIAGVVWSPGMDVFQSYFDTGRQFEERSAASVFGSLKNGEEDFGINTYNLFAANLEYFTEKKDIEKRVFEQTGASIQIGDVRQIKANIENGAKRLLNTLSTVAVAAIAVASLGVMNTIMASIRSRRWQLGVLRSIGVTRGAMVRLLVAEALLLGSVACVLGVAAGLLMAVNARGLSRRLTGYGPPIVVPWDVVAFGVGLILVVAAVSSLWPSARAAREEPLELLQSGRAAA
jgi:putative ABC transport system permease protein